jgi:hypothetical protein
MYPTKITYPTKTKGYIFYTILFFEYAVSSASGHHRVWLYSVLTDLGPLDGDSIWGLWIVFFPYTS